VANVSTIFQYEREKQVVEVAKLLGPCCVPHGGLSWQDVEVSGASTQSMMQRRKRMMPRGRGHCGPVAISATEETA